MLTRIFTAQRHHAVTFQFTNSDNIRTDFYNDGVSGT